MARATDRGRLSLLPGGKRATTAAGRVSLVGAGPGDPDLMTLKAARRIAEADVIFHDALVDHGVLAHARPDARLIDVGKRRGRIVMSQAAIERALVREALSGRRVVRLKGGDPFVFGRGGEEALALRRAGIRAEIVPGVTAGVAVPAAAGIPLTHRGLASSAAFVTAHDLGDGAGGVALRRRIGRLARAAETLVIFMSGAHPGRLRRLLLESGLAPETPAAVVESGTLAGERVRRGVVADLETLAGGRGAGPVLVVVGATVALAATLASEGTRPECTSQPTGGPALPGGPPDIAKGGS